MFENSITNITNNPLLLSKLILLGVVELIKKKTFLSP